MLGTTSFSDTSCPVCTGRCCCRKNVGNTTNTKGQGLGPGLQQGQGLGPGHGHGHTVSSAASGGATIFGATSGGTYGTYYPINTTIF